MRGKKVVIFCGGTGAATISKSFVSAGADVTLLVNGYDDGKSTGLLREMIPGMLGPSDFRKNIGRFSKFSVEMEQRPAPRYKSDAFGASWYGTLLDYLHPKYPNAGIEMLKDCPLGNIWFAGCYLEMGSCFNRTVARLNDALLDPSNLRVLNVTDGDNLWLRGITSSGKILTEAAISAGEYPMASWLFTAPALPTVGNAPIIPKTPSEVRAALGTADLIVYGPGTLESSIYPSYRSPQIGNAVGGNEKAKKVLITNLQYDYPYSASMQLFATQSDLRRGGALGGLRSVVTHVLVSQQKPYQIQQLQDKLTGDFSWAGDAVQLREVRSLENNRSVHDGDDVVRECISILMN